MIAITYPLVRTALASAGMIGGSLIGGTLAATFTPVVSGPLGPIVKGLTFLGKIGIGMSVGEVAYRGVVITCDAYKDVYDSTEESREKFVTYLRSQKS